VGDSLFSGKRILLGVCGGIAAYKACELARDFIRAGAAVQVVLTPRAAQFVTPLTFAALTGKPAPVDEFPELGGQPQLDVYSHLNLTREIDCFVIAPATAATLAKLVTGQADNLVTGSYVSCTAPVVLAPAMNTRMWRHAAVQESVARLRARGDAIVEPGTGELACGDRGPGRLADLPDIVAAVGQALARQRVTAGPLAGQRIVVTAGGTREYLDPVRYITNASSGRLGLEVCRALIALGADVDLIETGIDLPLELAQRLQSRQTVRTAFDLQAALRGLVPQAQGLCMLAAVADYSPAQYQNTKHKKDGGAWAVELTQTPDVLAAIAAVRRPGQAVCGVSLEDTDWLDRAMKKAAAKRVDAMLAVELGADLPFGDSRLTCALVDAAGVLEQAGRRSKPEAAEVVARWFAAQLAPAGAVQENQ
jgi:phosphopantothenoylcysteine decarboxylase / phosphopantothenate---cysteine ligase